MGEKVKAALCQQKTRQYMTHVLHVDLSDKFFYFLFEVFFPRQALFFFFPSLMMASF